MRDILIDKADYCLALKSTLIGSGVKDLVECTQDLFWASGLALRLTATTKPSFYPESHMLGNILDSVRRDLIKGAVITSITATDMPRPHHSKQLSSDTLQTEPLNTSLLPSEPLSSAPLPSEPLPSEPLPSEQLPTVPLPSEPFHQSSSLQRRSSHLIMCHPIRPQRSLCHANHTPLNLPVSNRVQKSTTTSNLLKEAQSHLCLTPS